MTNRDKFLAGLPFQVSGRPSRTFIYVPGNSRIDEDYKGVSDFHACVDKVGEKTFRAYKTIVSKTVYNTIRFSDLYFNL